MVIHDAGSPQHEILGPRRSHAARDPRAARLGRKLGHGSGGTVRHEHARRVEASEGAGACRPHFAQPRGAISTLPYRSSGAQGCGRLARTLSRVLGREIRPAERLPEENSGKGKETWPQETRIASPTDMPNQP